MKKIQLYFYVPTIILFFTTVLLLANKYNIITINKITNQPATIKNFGAKGDGIADDTNAIIAAIEGTTGGLVRFPPGSYRITRTINIVLGDNGPIGVSGEGGTARVIMEGDGPAFRFTGSHRGTASPASVTSQTWEKERMPLVFNMEIIGAHPNANGLEFRFTYMPVISSVLIRDMHHGIHFVSRSRNVIITNSHIYNCRGTGVLLDSVSIHQIIISNSHISYNLLGGIKVTSKSDVHNFQITGNDIEYNCNPEGPVSADIWIDCSEGGIVMEGTISGNTIQAIPSPDGANIRFTGTSGSYQKVGLWSITGNHISNQTVNIHLDHSQGISITGNTFIRGYNRHLMIENSRNLIINANVFDYNSDYFPEHIFAPGGITIAECINLILGDNIIDGVEFGTSDKGGSITVTESREITIRGCHISNPRYRGIEINSSHNVHVFDCRIYEDVLSPLMLSAIEVTGSCSGTIIRNNSIGYGKRGDIVNNALGVIIEANFRR